MNYVIFAICGIQTLWPERVRDASNGRGGRAWPTRVSNSPHPYPIPSTEMTTLPRFRLSIRPPAPEMSSGPIALPTKLTLDLRTDPRTEDPATSRHPGSFNYDRENGFPLEWSNLAEFHAWRREEELAYTIELIGSTVTPGNALWLKKRLFVCSRQLSGGRSKYPKKFPDRQRKIESKKTGCDCKIVIKLYHHTPIVLGRYEKEHDHEIGLANIAYTRMSRVAREQIRAMLLQKVDPREIVRKWALPS
jgi:hypothetical protein